MKSARSYLGIKAGVLALSVAGAVAGCKTAPTSTLRDDNAPTGWAGARAQKEQALSDYLTKQRPNTYDMYMNRPLGFNGVPLVVIRAMIDMFPDIWTPDGTLNHLGFPPRPNEYTQSGNGMLDGTLTQGPRSTFPSGMAWTNDPTYTYSAIAKQWLPTPQTDNVFFACGGCHTGRVHYLDASGQHHIKFMIGAPSTEVEAQHYAELLWLSAGRFTNKWSPDREQIQFNTGKVAELIGTLVYYKLRLEGNSPSTIFSAAMQPGKLVTDELLRTALQYLASDPDLQNRLSQANITPDYFYPPSQHQTAQYVLNQINTVLTVSPQVAVAWQPVLWNFVQVPYPSISQSVQATAANSPVVQVVLNLLSAYGKVQIMYKELGSQLTFIPDPVTGQMPPSLFGPRPGQMDAFGLVQGIAPLNSARPDRAWWNYLAAQPNPKANPIMAPIGDTGGHDDPKSLAYYGQTTARTQWFGSAFGVFDLIEPTDDQKNTDRQKAQAQWYPKAPALSDIKSLVHSGDKYHANWDGNQGEASRALSSGVSSVGDPLKVDVWMHGAMNPFINDLPMTPYPFPVNDALAALGAPIYQAKCATCHFPRNNHIYGPNELQQAYNDKPTDMNRATVMSPLSRRMVIGLADMACDAGLKRSYFMPQFATAPSYPDDLSVSSTWCQSADKSGNEGDIYREIDTPSKTRIDRDLQTGAPLMSAQDSTKPLNSELGYKADALYSIWAQAPYLHNGSVPTLWHLFRPNARPARFVRGNINYDQKWVGFVWDLTQDGSLLRANQAACAAQIACTTPGCFNGNNECSGAQDNNAYGPGDTVHTGAFDTTLRGNGNQGHNFGSELSEDEVSQLMEYMKTL